MRVKTAIFKNFAEELNRDEVTLLFLIPLIQTAWACGAISPREKQVIFTTAREDGIDERHNFNDVLNEMLTNQPGKQFFEDCLVEIRSRLLEMTVAERRTTREKILSRCKNVAASAGGKSLMDINHNISDRELDLLSDIHDSIH